MSAAQLGINVSELPIEETREITAARHSLVLERMQAVNVTESGIAKRRRESEPGLSSRRRLLSTSKRGSTGTTQLRTQVTVGIHTDSDLLRQNTTTHQVSGNSFLDARPTLRQQHPHSHVSDEIMPEAVTNGTASMARADINSPNPHSEDQEDDVDDCNDIAEFDAPESSLAAQLDCDEWDKDEELELNAEGVSVRGNDEMRLSSVPKKATGRFASTKPDLANLRNRMKKIFTWEKMVSYLAICGRAPFSTEQYRFLTAVLASQSQDPEYKNTLQDYKTARRHMQTCLATWCFPKNSVYFVESVARPRGTSKTQIVQTVNAGKKPAQSCVRIVWPTSWAKLDVATYTFYADVFEHPRRGHPDHLSIENAPIVHSRAAFIGRNPTLWVWFNGVPCIAKAGDTVTVPFAARPVQILSLIHI